MELQNAVDAVTGLKQCLYCGRMWPDVLLFAVDDRCPKCQVEKIAEVRARQNAELAFAIEVGSRAWRHSR